MNPFRVDYLCFLAHLFTRVSYVIPRIRSHYAKLSIATWGIWAHNNLSVEYNITLVNTFVDAFMILIVPNSIELPAPNIRKTTSFGCAVGAMQLDVSRHPHLLVPLSDHHAIEVCLSFNSSFIQFVALLDSGESSWFIGVPFSEHMGYPSFASQNPFPLKSSTGTSSCQEQSIKLRSH